MRAPRRPSRAPPRAARRRHATVARPRRSSAAAAWALGAALLAALVYADTLSNQLVYDDLGVIVVNRAVRDPGDWRTILLSHSWFAAPSREHRPFTTWTFALDYAAHGVAPLGYHLTNVVVHAGVTALVVLVALAAGTGLPVAGVAALLFAVHPVHTEAVASVVGRAELLAAGFGLLALLLARRLEAARRPAATVAGALAAYALGICSKEHVAALVAVVPLADLVLADAGAVGRFRERLTGRRGVLYAGLVAVTIGYLGLRRIALGNLVGAGGVVAPAVWQNPAAGVVWWQRTLTALDVQRRALGLFVFPLRLSADYSYRTITVVRSAADPRALAGLAVAAGLAALGAFWWRTGRRGDVFWLAFAWLVYLPVSNLVFPIGTIFAERVLYLPSVGFCVLLAELVVASRRWWMPLTALLVVVGGARTAVRNAAWHDDASLAEATVAASPDSTQAHRLLAWTLVRRGREDEALAEYRRAVELDPGNDIALADYAELLRSRRGADAAATALRTVAEAAPDAVAAWTALGTAEVARGRFEDALAAARHALERAPEDPGAEAVRGFALRGLGRREEARAAFTRALAIDATLRDGYTGLAMLAFDAGDAAGAAKVYEAMIRATESREAYAGLVETWRRAGRDAEAEQARAAARRRFPTDPAFR